MSTTRNIIEHATLGTFRRTGVRRVPVVGEYYYCDHAPGIAICTVADGVAKEILERMTPRKVRVPLQSKRGGL